MKNIVQFCRFNNAPALILALTLLFSSFSGPAIAKSNRFTDYINRPFYEKKLFNAAAAEALKEIACGTPGTKVMRTKLKILSKIRFSKKRIHPVEGIWREETHVILCGKNLDINVTVVATPNASPAFLAKED